MSALLDEHSEMARMLNVEERARLAQELLESERESHPDVQAAWEAETLHAVTGDPNLDKRAAVFGVISECLNVNMEVDSVAA